MHMVILKCDRFFKMRPLIGWLFDVLNVRHVGNIGANQQQDYLQILTFEKKVYLCKCYSFMQISWIIIIISKSNDPLLLLYM